MASCQNLTHSFPVRFKQEFQSFRIINKRNIETVENQAHQSNFEFTSKEKVDSIGVMASCAVCQNQVPILREITFD